MTNPTKKVLTIVALAILTIACEKSHSQTKGEGVLRDFSELDGCGWVIELNPRNDSNERLEPLNLNDFDIQPIDGMSVEIKYHETNAMSICMVGKTVELTKIEEK